MKKTPAKKVEPMMRTMKKIMQHEKADKKSEKKGC